MNDAGATGIGRISGAGWTEGAPCFSAFKGRTSALLGKTSLQLGEFMTMAREFVAKGK
jgi:hypothetical protein